MLSEPKSLCTAIGWLKRSGCFLNQVFPCVLNDNYAHADKVNMYKNMYEYLSMTSQTCVFKMAITCTGYYSYSSLTFTLYVARASAETTLSLCCQSLIIFKLAIGLMESPCIASATHIRTNTSIPLWLLRMTNIEVSSVQISFHSCTCASRKSFNFKLFYHKVQIKYTYLQNKRMRRCGVAPPPIIF